MRGECVAALPLAPPARKKGKVVEMKCASCSVENCNKHWVLRLPLGIRLLIAFFLVFAFAVFLAFFMVFLAGTAVLKI